MAEEAENDTGGGSSGGGDVIEAPVKCEECIPGLPGWMATFSDLVTLLLTFFVLLLSFAKTESAKYEAALGSIRNAFGGNVLKHGEVIQRGKSPDDSPTMMESQEPIQPFPIDFLTMEGILDKHEVNRESDETLKNAKSDLSEFALSDNVDIYEMSEGIKIIIKDKLYFNEGGTTPIDGGVPVEVYKKLVNLLSQKDWTLYVMGHSSRGEVGKQKMIDDNGETIVVDAFSLSSLRATAVARSIIGRGVAPTKVITSFFGDTKPEKILGREGGENQSENRRVEFMLRKRDLTAPGHKVESR